MLQSFVSLRRIEKYLEAAEVEPVQPLDGVQHPIVFQSATVTWPQDRSGSSSNASSIASTPRRKFSLIDLNLNFPAGELSLICGKLGSGKTLLLLCKRYNYIVAFSNMTNYNTSPKALLGEADLLAGQVSCPRSPPNIIASFEGVVPPPEEWIVNGACAYVPQVYFNIIFSMINSEMK